MSSNWISTLDACASAGILNYDAPADILGEKPRYYGNPDFESLETTRIPHGTKIKDQPKVDEFSTEDKNIVKNPTWKKTLFGGLILACLTGIGLFFSKGKCKNLGSKIKNAVPSLKNLGTKILDLGKQGLNFVKTSVTNLINKFKKTP